MSNISFEVIKSSALSDFSSTLNLPSDPYQYVDDFISENFELSHQDFTILHAGYDRGNETYFGFTSLRISNDIDDIPGLFAELLYVKPPYRGKINKTTGQKYSYDMLDYIIQIGIQFQKNAAVNHIFLVPVTQEVRNAYKEYGFENLPDSGKNEFEDYMVFNLLA